MRKARERRGRALREALQTRMNSSELHRKLLYCGYTDLSDYLQSPLNRYIYKQLLAKSQEYAIDKPMLVLFNEIYYECVRIQSDGRPGDNLSLRYLKEEEAWLGSHIAARLVFCVVWAILQRKRQLRLPEACFVEGMTPMVEACEFSAMAHDMVSYMEAENLYAPYDFSPMPCPIQEIPERIDLQYHSSMTVVEKIKSRLSLPVESSAVDFNPWRNITDHFSSGTIKWYLMLYSTREDQLALLKRIEKACTKEEYNQRRSFFKSLEGAIRYGDFIFLSDIYCHNDYDYEIERWGEGEKEKTTDIQRVKDSGSSDEEAKQVTMGQGEQSEGITVNVHIHQDAPQPNFTLPDVKQFISNANTVINQTKE